MRALALALALASSAAARDFADSFERDADRNDVPDGWNLLPDPAAPKAGTLSRGEGRDGSALVLEVAPSATASAEARLSGRLDLANDYVLSGWVKLEAAKGARAWLSVQFVDEKGDSLGAAQMTPVAEPGDWEFVVLPVSLIDSRTRSLAVRCHVSNAAGDAFARARFDDVSWVAKAFVDSFETDLDKDGFPDRWQSIKGDEFPAFNAIGTRIATEDSRTGTRAALLKTSGRHVGLETRWAISVDADRAYELRAWVRTDGLEEAAAWAEVQWLDEGERPLGSARTAGVRGDAAWTPVALAVEDVPARARFARLRLVVGGADTAGQAWFDDVEWLGRIKLRLDTQGRAGNVYRESEALESGGVTGNIVALGLESGAYEVFAEVTDADGKVAWNGRVGGDELNIRETLLVPFKFETKTPGPYSAVIRIKSSGQPLVEGRATYGIAHDFVFPRGRAGDYGAWFNPWTNPARRPGGLFGLGAMGRVRVPVWDPAAVDHHGLTPDGDDMHELLLDLRRNGLEVVGVLASPPGRAVGVPLAEWFASRDRAWEEPFTRLVTRHRDVVSAWQLGAGDLTLARMEDSSVLEKVRGRLRSAHEYATLGLPVAPNLPPPASEHVQFLAVDLDAEARDGLSPGLAADARDRLYTIAPADSADLARRLVEARRRGFEAVDVGGDGALLLEPTGGPTRAWYTLRLLNDLLSGAKPVEGELLPGLFSFKKEGKLIVAVRSGEKRILDAWLGAKLVRLDLMGRRTTVPTDASGRQKIETGPEVAFLVVSDTAFAETQLSAKFEGTPLRSRTNPQPVTFVLTNKFLDSIRNLRIVEVELPGRWRPMSTATELSAVSPEETARFPLEAGLPSDVRPGSYEIRVRVSFMVGTTRREAVLTRTLSVEPEVDVRPRIEETPDGKGLEVTVAVTNRGTRKVDFKIYVNRGPGTRTLDDVVYGLEPGAEKIVRFLAEKDTAGKEYRIGLRGIEDDLFVNEVVKVP